LAPDGSSGTVTGDPLLDGGLRLTLGSPCVDAGLATGLTPDLAGIPRPLDGTGDGVAGYDIGAFELVHPTADTDRDGMGDAAELTADTAPDDPDCYLRITDIRKTGSGVDVHWRGGCRVPQILETREHLTGPAEPWVPLHTVSPPTPVLGSYLHGDPVGTQRFYRIRIP